MEEEKDLLLKVLLVDDEPFIRKGLAALIDWEAEGYIIAGEAQNGIEAIEKLSGEECHLVISDIKMPDMTGIELIRYLKEKKLSRAKFVFLSGFYDFQYAKSAILWGCSDYVLKPIQREELLNILRRIRSSIEEETGGHRNRNICEKAYLDRNLLALLWGNYDEINLNYARTRLQPEGEVRYIHLEICLSDENFMGLSEDKKKEQHRKLYSYAGLLLKNYSDRIIFGAAKHTVCYDIGILYSTFMTGGKEDEEWFDWLVKELKERLGYEIVACAGSWVSGIEGLADSFKEASMMRFFRFDQKIEKESVNRSGIRKMQPKNQARNQKKNSQEEYYRKELDCLIHGIETCDKIFIRENAGSLYRRMMDKCTDTELIGLNIQYYLYRLLGLAYEIETDINQEEVMSYIQEAAFSTGMPWINEHKFRKFAEDYSDYLVQLRQNSARGVMCQIEAEIESNYADNISLKSLGEKYYLNSAYLGQIFKKSYGCSFKEYINGVRIRKAAEMLLRTDEKVYEIGEKVGYKNMEYFINKFEGIYGVTPARFRKRNYEALKEA